MPRTLHPPIPTSLSTTIKSSLSKPQIIRLDSPCEVSPPPDPSVVVRIRPVNQVFKKFSPDTLSIVDWKFSFDFVSCFWDLLSEGSSCSLRPRQELADGKAPLEASGIAIGRLGTVMHTQCLQLRLSLLQRREHSALRFQRPFPPSLKPQIIRSDGPCEVSVPPDPPMKVVVRIRPVNQVNQVFKKIHLYYVVGASNGKHGSYHGFRLLEWHKYLSISHQEGVELQDVRIVTLLGD
nr:hypothetical protein CFP56_41870 [Quercus suber]